ncbi:MAG: hypothetical protein ACR2NX_15850, partial [Chthoniobacterales bacterium]
GEAELLVRFGGGGFDFEGAAEERDGLRETALLGAGDAWRPRRAGRAAIFHAALARRPHVSLGDEAASNPAGV